MTVDETETDWLIEEAAEAGADPDVARSIYEEMLEDASQYGREGDQKAEIARSAVRLATLAARCDVDPEITDDAGEDEGEQGSDLKRLGDWVAEADPDDIEVPPSLNTDRRDPLADDFRIGDPVIDLATGRSMVVVEHLANRVDEYEDFDLLGHYAAQRTRVSPADPVIGCIYTASIQSEPSGPRHGDPPYAFASSRLGRPTIESVDGYDRVYSLVARDVLERLLAHRFHVDPGALDDTDNVVYRLAIEAGLDDELVEEAHELAEIATEGP